MLETLSVSFGGGLYSADLPSAIPDNYCSVCKNAIPTGTSVENRFGIQVANVNFSESRTLKDTLPTSFTYFGPTGNPDDPIIMYGSDFNGSSRLHLIREGDPFTDPGGDTVATGYIDAAITGGFVGAVNYNGTFYVFYDTGVHKITAVDWVASSFTISSVVGSPTAIEVPPIHFFDRLWTAQGNKLLFTDAIATPGALPETWNTGTNFISIIGENGPGKIYKLIPVGSRIYIFTSQGLFSLTIAGNPSDWYLRSMDENAIVNSYECAFEVGGLIYYVTIYGVFVTNGADSIKLSGPIENFFLAGNFDSSASSPTKRSNIYRINYLDNGLIVSISNYVISSGTAYYETNNSHNFYTRLGNTAWSEWNYETAGETGTTLTAVVGTADSVESYINKTPLSYIMVLNSSSTSDIPSNPTRELCVYDGLKDTWTHVDGQPGNSADIKVEIKTKYFDSESPTTIKTLPHAYLELFISDKDKYGEHTTWHYAWNTDSEERPYHGDQVNAINPGDVSTPEFHLVAVDAGLSYRSCQFTFTFDTNNSETFKVKNLYLQQKVVGNGPNSIQ